MKFDDENVEKNNFDMMNEAFDYYKKSYPEADLRVFASGFFAGLSYAKEDSE